MADWHDTFCRLVVQCLVHLGLGTVDGDMVQELAQEQEQGCGHMERGLGQRPVAQHLHDE